MSRFSERPQLRADGTYCAPFCGRGCTKAEHDAAVQKAAALAEALGPPWQPRVWENLGWHFAAMIEPDGPLGSAVHPMSSTGGWWASILAGGAQFIGEAKEPRDAVAEAVARLRAARDAMSEAIERLAP